MTTTKTLLTTAAMYGAILLASGGCSMFRYDNDDAPPPIPAARPTTVPSEETADMSSISGASHEIFIDFPVRVYEFLTGKTPAGEASAMEDAKTPDARRDGINSLAERTFGKQPPYTTRYRQIGQFDTNPQVRATAIRALNRSRDGESSGLFVAGLADESVQVRLEAAKALANVPNENALQPLLGIFNNAAEDVDVRVAAGDALRHYRKIEVARALINVLNDREFALAWQARQSLRAITGNDKRYDQTAWLQLISGPQNPLG